MEVLVNSCIRELDRIGVRGRRKSCAMRPQEEGRHAVSNITRAVSMKIAIGDRQRCSIPARREGMKTLSQRREVDSWQKNKITFR